MRILHVTDLHFIHSACEWVTQNQDLGDIVCLTGDFLDTRDCSQTSLRDQVEFYTAWFEEFDKPLFVCSGNHDFEFESGEWLSNQRLRSANGDGAIVKMNNLKVGCVPYKGSLLGYSSCDVLLYHEPPAQSSTSKQGGVDYGCSELRYALKSGSLNASHILCGHVHKPLKTAVRIKGCTVINPGAVHTEYGASHAVISIE